MANINDLYNQVLKDHRSFPRNKGLKEDERYRALRAKNPSCGDSIVVQLLIEDGIIKDVRHEGTGCAICCSSASVMSEVLKGKTIEEADSIIKDFYELIKGEVPSDEDRLGDAVVYVNIHNFPPRAKCATLAWRAVDTMINTSREGDIDYEQEDRK